jgi:hypothetical protein
MVIAILHCGFLNTSDRIFFFSAMINYYINQAKKQHPWDDTTVDSLHDTC